MVVSGVPVSCCAFLTPTPPPATPKALAAEIARQCGAWLKGGQPDLLLLFSSAQESAAHQAVMEALAHATQPRVLAGCTCSGVLSGASEIEEAPAAAALLIRSPGLDARVVVVTQDTVQEANGPGFWHFETGLDATQARAVLLLADPFTVNAEALVREISEAYPDQPVLGGLASALDNPRNTWLFLDGRAIERGALVLVLDGPFAIEPVVSQGCMPVGEPFIITRADDNVLFELGGRPAWQALQSTVEGLPPGLQQQARHNLFLGVAVNEYTDEFQRGDFLIRNLIGGDRATGALVAAAHLNVGKTVQFQIRSAAAAREDMAGLLAAAATRLAPRPPRGALLFSCSGRGASLFGEPGHDARALQEAVGPIPAAGFFCNGEIGPVGARAFVHGYTCSAALFTEPDPEDDTDSRAD